MEKSYVYIVITDNNIVDRLNDLRINPDKIRYGKDRPKSAIVKHDSFSYYIPIENNEIKLTDNNYKVLDAMDDNEDNLICVVLHIYKHSNKLILSNKFISGIHPKIKILSIDTYKYFEEDDTLNTTMRVYYDNDKKNAITYGDCYNSDNNIVDFIQSNPVDKNKVINVEYDEFYDSYAIIILEAQTLELLKKYNLSAVFTFN